MCCPAQLSACGNHSGEAERYYGVGLKLFGFVPEPVFAFIPESCSRSTRTTVRNHPGIAFILPRIPLAHMELDGDFGNTFTQKEDLVSAAQNCLNIAQLGRDTSANAE